MSQRGQNFSSSNQDFQQRARAPRLTNLSTWLSWEGPGAQARLGASAGDAVGRRRGGRPCGRPCGGGGERSSSAVCGHPPGRPRTHGLRAPPGSRPPPWPSGRSLPAFPGGLCFSVPPPQGTVLPTEPPPIPAVDLSPESRRPWVAQRRRAGPRLPRSLIWAEGWRCRGQRAGLGLRPRGPGGKGGLRLGRGLGSHQGWREGRRASGLGERLHLAELGVRPRGRLPPAEATRASTPLGTPGQLQLASQGCEDLLRAPPPSVGRLHPRRALSRRPAPASGACRPWRRCERLRWGHPQER
jgi:hypothetical protein